MYDFAYHRPKSVADAAALLKGKEEARPMSGGMTLIPTLKQRLARPSDIVDLGAIKELAGVKVELPIEFLGIVWAPRCGKVTGLGEIHADPPGLSVRDSPVAVSCLS